MFLSRILFCWHCSQHHMASKLSTKRSPPSVFQLPKFTKWLQLTFVKSILAQTDDQALIQCILICFPSKSMHFESMNDTLEPSIIAAESKREWFLILLMYVHTVPEWRMSIVKKQKNWFYKNSVSSFFQDCYCVIKKWKIMNSNLTHSLQNFRPKLVFEQQQGIFTSVERNTYEKLAL